MPIYLYIHKPKRLQIGCDDFLTHPHNQLAEEYNFCFRTFSSRDHLVRESELQEEPDGVHGNEDKGGGTEKATPGCCCKGGINP